MSMWLYIGTTFDNLSLYATEGIGLHVRQQRGKLKNWLDRTHEHHKQSIKSGAFHASEMTMEAISCLRRWANKRALWTAVPELRYSRFLLSRVASGSHAAASTCTGVQGLRLLQIRFWRFSKLATRFMEAARFLFPLAAIPCVTSLIGETEASSSKQVLDFLLCVKAREKWVESSWITTAVSEVASDEEFPVLGMLIVEMGERAR